MTVTALTAAGSIGVQAFVVALSGAMAPGPLLTVTVEQSIRRGWTSAMLLMIGHALLEALLLVGFAFGLQGVLVMPAVKLVLALLGGAFLIWMGAGMLREAAGGRLTLAPGPSEAPTSRFGPVLQGAVVSLSNPYWTIWWAVVGLKFASDALSVGPVAVGSFFVGHELADFGWYAVVAGVAAGGKRFMSDRAYRVIIGGCALALVYIGVTFVLAGLDGRVTL